MAEKSAPVVAPDPKGGPSQQQQVSTGFALPFRASNLDEVGFTGTGDAVLGAACTDAWTIDTERGTIQCDDGAAALTVGFTTTKARTVFSAHRFVVEAGARARVVGDLPAIFVARDTISIAGILAANGNGSKTSAGGTNGPATSATRGVGAGGGGAGKDAPTESGSGAGGGSYCGRGGAGGVSPGESGGQPGSPYGTAEIIPLVGGSSGGSTASYDGKGAGAGGGAIQLVAGGTIDVAGTVHVGGGGGSAPCIGAGSGGGSGGAILIEASTVTITGTLAANGGAGASSGAACTNIPSSVDATANDRSVSGPPEDNRPRGGTGSAGPMADGVAGTVGVQTDVTQGAGGGGGAGRIRVNTSSGSAAWSSAVVSPNAKSGCASEGKLR